MDDAVNLLGLDFGTTTSSAVAARGRLLRNVATGRMEVADVHETFRSDLVYTPLEDDRLDLPRIERYLDGWLSAANLKQGDIFGGGALLTGLTARRDNAAGLVERIKTRLANALVARADDPCLESWLAFMGSAAPLSRELPERHVLNFDIGGGTTNIALGKAGEVLRVGCLFVGARHVEVEPGTYRLIRLSSHARELFAAFNIRKGPGDTLCDDDVKVILDFHMALLEKVVTRVDACASTLVTLHEQVPLSVSADEDRPLVTFSGGVGELIYNFLRGGGWPSATGFGDLGIDLAKRIVASGAWGDDWRRHQPASGGRATVYGLLRHSTEVSGATVFLPRDDVLPLTDVPIFGSASLETDAEQFRRLLDLTRRSERGGCLHVAAGTPSAESVRRLAAALRGAILEAALPPRHPLVLLVSENIGKVLGQAISAWQTPPCDLVVLDEVTLRDAQYVHLGAARHQVVPVSFYGLGE